MNIRTIAFGLSSLFCASSLSLLCLYPRPCIDLEGRSLCRRNFDGPIDIYQHRGQITTRYLYATPMISNLVSDKKSPNISEKNGVPTHESLKALKYLNAVIKETLCLFPSSAMLSRCSKGAPLTLPGADGTAYYLPPKAQVVLSSLLVHRRRDLWSDTCDDFIPERWFDPSLQAKLNAIPFMYFPFLGGPRTCIYQNFAYNEAEYFIVRLLQQFQHLELAPHAQPDGASPPQSWKLKGGRQAIERMWPSIAFTLYVKGGLWINAQ